MSKYIAEAAQEKRNADDVAAASSERNRQRETLECLWAEPMWNVTENGRMLTAEERNARR
jgi:hypothetical protein